MHSNATLEMDGKGFWHYPMTAMNARGYGPSYPVWHYYVTGTDVSVCKKKLPIEIDRETKLPTSAWRKIPKSPCEDCKKFVFELTK